MLIAGDDGITLSTTMGNRANAVPFTVFIDEDGAIQKTHAGEIILAGITRINSYKLNLYAYNTTPITLINGLLQLTKGAVGVQNMTCLLTKNP